MAPRTARRSTKKVTNDALEAARSYNIPYFAHMVLDPNRFPYSVGMAVGQPPVENAEYAGLPAGHGAWLADESEDEDSDDDWREKKKGPLKRGRKSSAGTSVAVVKRPRVEGGRPATAKKVTANLDSDDELIVAMKNAKYQEKDIAYRLVAEGRINYNPKTIGTRWARIKRKLQERQDQMLDDELTDWHDGDDEVLSQAIAKAEAEVNRLKQDAEEKRWKIVADEMKTLKPVTNFSKNACRDRAEAIRDGTARPCPESIINPDEKIQARIQSRVDKQQRIDEDANRFAAFDKMEFANITENGWTSRTQKY